ncbi:integumentary mucin C.1-like [Mytilus californianus]|uniref:integumentary mucin C.1-like n=1 Tax=Mytilus californianus TaxID=6549 RepID=UPI002246E091|nr:integumentary mucin C.1-like [Mytilus californianus]
MYNIEYIRITLREDDTEPTDITNGNCPDPPQDWTCHDLDHTAAIPRTQCIDPTQETTTEIVTTTETMTTTVPTTTETITTAVPTTTETITTAVPTTTETITTAVPTTTETITTAVPTTTETITTAVPTTTETITTAVPTTTETITTAVPTTIDSATTTTKLGSTSGNSISESTSSPSNSNNTCYCPCNSGGYLVLTDAELKEKIEKIISEIKIDPKATSLAKRKLISAVDSRPSAKAVGSLGIVILVVIAGFIIIMDSNVIFRSIEQLIAKRKKNKSIEEN